MNQTQLAPEINDTNLSGRWMTVIFNDDHTPMDLVVLTIMVATRCDATEAEIMERHLFTLLVNPNAIRLPA
jgi:ATP-dependent Clp protease adaptor protein ClpS